MRIVCPICSATYEVRDDLLAPGRTVRCARCGEQWVPIATASSAPSEIAVEPSAPPPPREPPAATSPRWTAMDRLASQPAPLPRTGYRLHIAWAASLVVLLLCGWGIYAWRTDVMHAWPPSARLYDALGLAPATPPAH